MPARFAADFNKANSTKLQIPGSGAGPVTVLTNSSRRRFALVLIAGVCDPLVCPKALLDRLKMYSAGIRISRPQIQIRMHLERNLFALSIRETVFLSRHADVHIEADRLDVPVLLAAEQNLPPAA